MVIHMYYWSTEGRDVFEGKKGGGEGGGEGGWKCVGVGVCIIGALRVGIEHSVMASICHSVPQIHPPCA